MTTSSTTRAGGIMLVALIAAAGCSSKTHATSAATSAPASTAVASTAPVVSSPAAPSGTPAASTAPAVSSPAAPTSAPTTSPAAPATAPAVSLAGFKPASVTFVSATQGFVLGEQTCATGSCATLAATVNGGSTWTYAGAGPAAISGPNPAVSKVRFATTNDGWAFGPQLWSTHDGGRTWTAQATPGPVSDVEAAGGVAYALEASCGTPPCIQGDRLLQTPVSTDGWTAISGPKLADGPGSLAPHGNTVWVVVNGGGTSTFDMVVGGTVWHRLANPCTAAGADLALVGVAPVSTSALFELCAGDPGAGSETKVVLFSSDGGAHATATGAAPARGGIASGIAAASTAVVAVPAASGASYVYRSADGGHTWATPLSQGDGGVGYFDVGFTTATQGVAVYGNPAQGNSSLLMTHDAGATWKAVTF
jgi:photosystem II stability/assembly factor-like uncharacterized protein